MKLKILKSVLVIGGVISLITVTASAALFTDSATVENNTFATGNVNLKLYNYCAEGMSWYNLGDGRLGSIVECPVGGNGSLERDGLKYDVADGATYNYLNPGDIYNKESGTIGDWTSDNFWWDALSSAMDHTNIYPGWSFNSYPNNDFISVGNAGTLPINLTATVTYEAQDYAENLEPLDGTLPGGDRIDPLNDSNWIATLSKIYDTNLASVINVKMERVDNNGNPVGTPYTGTLAGLVASPNYSLGTLNPDEVAYIRFNWSLPTNVGNDYQGRIFDYSVTFNAANTTP